MKNLMKSIGDDVGLSLCPLSVDKHTVGEGGELHKLSLCQVTPEPLESGGPQQ